MKHSILVLSVALLFSSASKAEGMEEICSRVADSDVRMKNTMSKNPAFFTMALSELEMSNSKNKEALREKLFFIKNRLYLPDPEFKRITFLRCITETW